MRRLAREKAEAAWERDREIVLGADTTVVLDDRVLEKPLDAADARRDAAPLSGRKHIVITGIALIQPAIARSSTWSKRACISSR